MSTSDRKTEYRADIRQEHLDDSFWNYYEDLVLHTVIPYQEDILNDRVPGAEKSHALENFRIAAGRSTGEFYGMVFQDSDAAKWAEAVSNALALTGEAELSSKMDQFVDLISAAQEEDGYLDTYFQIKAPKEKWTDLQEAHELYCMGHMIEAAVSHFEATGKKDFLQAGIRMADCIDRRFGKEKTRGIPGHPEIEIALMRLYHVTGEKRYLDLAEYFIDERGTEPNYFAKEKERRTFSVWDMDPADRAYQQNDVPVRQASAATGHAVRAVYLYTAMADLASETGDQELADACRRLWEDITGRQMYVTGAVGQTARGEAFTRDYDLPNDTAYAETCAAVGMIFFARRMLQLETRGEYGDVMERVLYNGMLSGMQHDGKRFFYVNPLESDPSVDGKVPEYSAVLVKRPRWYACACCPPNAARLITSLPRYAWGENADTIYSHLYLGGTFASKTIPGVTLLVKSAYPWKGEIRYQVTDNRAGRAFTLALRVPAWAGKYEISLNGEIISPVLKNGYVYITRTFLAGDEVLLTFPMRIRRVYANGKVRKDAGLVCLMRGPIVYALEQEDNGGQLYNLMLPRSAQLTEEWTEEDEVLGPHMRLHADGGRQILQEQSLYSEIPPREEKQALTFIPYFLWANRNPGEMRVWIREQA